ncbi:urease accessory protein UreE [Kineococcus sp. SYSU DK006]|uniref:urease accessory protein UreE n=1 Tax=Kineococcus sp. SYSU DK006 TaxID=3383127 RepID=UPI003D7CEA8B
MSTVTTGAPDLVGRTLTTVLGHEREFAAQLHALSHRGAVDEVEVAEEDLPRRRLRLTSRAGTTYALSLPRGARLADGSVLRLDGEGAVVVRTRAAGRLRLRPLDPGAALRLGFLAGHLHWVVELADDPDGGDLEVVLQAPVEEYLARLPELLDAGRVEWAAVGRP